MPLQRELWNSAVLEKRAAAIATPSLHKAHMRIAWSHEMGREVIRPAMNRSLKIWLAHTRALAELIKACVGSRATMAWAVTAPTCRVAWCPHHSGILPPPAIVE